jgi:hypothetical protein
MLKNESARNPMKPTPLCPARLPDFGGIIFMSNGVRMKKISHSVRRAKQAKFWMLTVPVRTVRTGHVSVRTVTHGTFRTVMWRSYSDTWQPQSVTRVRQIWHFGHDWTNPEVTRVTTRRVTRGTG